MPKSILVGFDGSPWALAAAQMACQLGRRMQAKLVLLQAVEEHHQSDRTFGPSLVDDFRSALAAADAEVARLGCAGVGVDTTTLVGEPVRLIMRAIDDLEPALVAVGTFGLRRVENWILGSVADKLARSAPVPVLLMPRREYKAIPYGEPFRALAPIVVPETTRQASHMATGPHLPFPSDVTLLAAASSDVPASDVLRFAQEGGYDLIALTRPGSGNGRRMLLEPAAEAIIQRSQLPVLVLPPNDLVHKVGDAHLRVAAA